MTSFCDHCGGEIEFRYVGGVLRPLHIGGTYCPGSSTNRLRSARSAFDKVESYLDPNARCPVCGASVYFYRSPYNGRVFFDDVGWPWPKHPCTDKYKGSDAGISRPSGGRLKFHLRGQDGKAREIYQALRVIFEEQDLYVRLKRVGGAKEFRVKISKDELSKQGVVGADIHEAPTIVVLERKDARVEFGFLCGRLQAAVILLAEKMNEYEPPHRPPLIRYRR